MYNKYKSTELFKQEADSHTKCYLNTTKKQNDNKNNSKLIIIKRQIINEENLKEQCSCQMRYTLDEQQLEGAKGPTPADFT